jgi:hypothetical protein
MKNHLFLSVAVAASMALGSILGTASTQVLAMLVR